MGPTASAHCWQAGGLPCTSARLVSIATLPLAPWPADYASSSEEGAWGFRDSDDDWSDASEEDSDEEEEEEQEGWLRDRFDVFYDSALACERFEVGTALAACEWGAAGLCRCPRVIG